MHELGLVFEMARVIEEALADQEVTAVDTVVVEIGELSSVVPHYFESCFPAARERPLFRQARLETVVLPAVGRCKRCGREYSIVPAKGYCPGCGSFDKELLTGREFNIREVRVV